MLALPAISEEEKIETVNEKIRLISKKNGLSFGTDAYLLAAFVPRMPSALAIDLGSGTGILPLLLLTRQKVKTAVAVEVQTAFCDLITRNAALNGVSDKITVLNCDLRELPKNLLACESADMVLSNPPYMKVDSGKPNVHGQKFIARHEVCGNIGDFCHAASGLLKYGGKFFCVYRPDRLVDLLSAMRLATLEPKKMTFVHANTASSPSMVLVEAKKGARGSLTLTKPLFLRTADGNMTPDAERIYETCSFGEF